MNTTLFPLRWSLRGKKRRWLLASEGKKRDIWMRKRTRKRAFSSTLTVIHHWPSPLKTRLKETESTINNSSSNQLSFRRTRVLQGFYSPFISPLQLIFISWADVTHQEEKRQHKWTLSKASYVCIWFALMLLSNAFCMTLRVTQGDKYDKGVRVWTQCEMIIREN